MSEEDRINSFATEIGKAQADKIMGNAKYIKFTKIKEKSKKVLHLNSIGELYKEPKDKYCYPMGESGRGKIFRYLATHKDYQKTHEISETLGKKSKQSIRTEIAKIRLNIKKLLKIDGKKMIESKKGYGYRINPDYKIILKNK